MARKPRIHFPGAFYHVMLRGNDKQNIFFSDSNRKYFYSLIQEGINRFNYRVHGFCLMDNHVHLAIQVGEFPLSKIIQNISFRYTRYINHLQNRIGHLFQGRFKAILVDADEYLLSLIRYIHQNPLRSKIVSTLEEYTWSSYRSYIKLEKIPWLTTEFVYGYFDDHDLSEFINFMGDSDEKINNKFIVGNHSTYAILGEDKFLEKLENNNIAQLIQKPSLERLVKIICVQYSIDEKNLKTKLRYREATKLRAIITWLARELDICTASEVGKYFNRDSTNILRSLRKLESNLSKDLMNLKELVIKAI